MINNTTKKLVEFTYNQRPPIKPIFWPILLIVMAAQIWISPKSGICQINDNDQLPMDVVNYTYTYTPYRKNKTSKPTAAEKKKAYAKLQAYLKTKGASKERQLIGIRTAANFFQKESIDDFRNLLESSKYDEVKLLLIRLLCTLRDPDDIPRFVKLLDSPNPEIRAAAIDGIGIIRLPAFPISRGNATPGREGPETRCFLEEFPKINMSRYLSDITLRKNRVLGEPYDTKPKKIVEVLSAIRKKIETRMLHSNSVIERQAAARTLVNWPKENYQLRLAEWSVWISDGENLTLVQSVIDEIPGFVHRTGNTYSSLFPRVNQFMIVTKPIIHLTSKDPMAVDVQVLMNEGRPWFAYPRPDDFQIHTTLAYRRHKEGGGYHPKTPAPLIKLDPVQQPYLAPLRFGYPWINPKHKYVGTSSVPMAVVDGNQIKSLGLRWQSLIVTPQKLPWMKPPVVAKKYSWWSQLRTVPSCWVSSLGETDRFLYYDGPTNLKSPYFVTLSEDTLRIEPNKKFPRWRNLPPRPQRNTGSDDGMIDYPIKAEQKNISPYVGFYIDVKNGTTTLHTVLYSSIGGQANILQLKNRFRGKEARKKLLQHAIRLGLTKEEANGLMNSWDNQFFETEGRRFIMFLTREQYDTFCPIGVRPAPTESVRVGIVLTEFD